MTKYSVNYRKYGNVIKNIKRLEDSIKRDVYKEYSKDFLYDLLKVIEKHGFDFEVRDYAEILEHMNSCTMEITHVVNLETLKKKYKKHLSYSKSPIERFMDCMRGGKR